MAAVQDPLKAESDSPTPKLEDDVGPPPYMDEDDPDEDAGDLDFSNVLQDLWLTKLPSSLWEILSDLKDDAEIELGTLRVEGNLDVPKRISLKLNDQPSLRSEPKEYILQHPESSKTSFKRPNNLYVFSEKNLPGYKNKALAWRNDVDGVGPVRSRLYEDNKREAKRRENKGRWTPYTRRSIPKHTALTGSVTRESECVPVENEEYLRLQDDKIAASLRQPDVPDLEWKDLKGATYQLPGTTTFDYSRATKQNAAAKADNRAARMDRSALMQGLFKLFEQYRFWGLREIKARINQPEAFLRETLDNIAVMHRQGDAVGKWELKDEYKSRDGASLRGGEGAADDGYAPSFEGEGEDDEDGDVKFEDVEVLE